MINLRGVLNGTAINRNDHFYLEMVREHHGMANIARMNITRRSCGRLYGSTISQICWRVPYQYFESTTVSRSSLLSLTITC